MFEQWKEGEVSAIREQYGKVRLLTLAMAAFIGLNMLGMAAMLLDRGGIVAVAVIAVQVAVIVLIWRLGDYRGRFIKPLLTSVEEEAYHTLEQLRPCLPANSEVDDWVAYGKTEEGRRQNRKKAGIELLQCILLVALLVLAVKLLGG